MNDINKDSNNINSLLDYRYFEKMVITALNKKLENEDISTPNEFILTQEYDRGINVIIKNGIDGLDGKTGVVIKFSHRRPPTWHMYKNTFQRLNKVLEEDKLGFRSLLFVVGIELTKREKEEWEQNLQKLIKYPIKLWAIEDLCEIDGNFEHFKNGDFSEIARLMVNNAVDYALTEDNDEWKKIREARLGELKDIYRRDELVLFLGAGVSKDAGIGEWGELISDLLVLVIKDILEDKKIKVTELETNFLLERMKKLNNQSPLLQAGFIKTILGPKFEERLSKLLYKNIRNKEQSQLLKSISKLCLPKRSGVGIQAVVTYNFDDLLELAFNDYNIEYQSLYNELDYATAEKLGIYHVHGFLPRNPEEYEQLSEGLLVFSEDGYHRLYNDPYSWANITQLNFLRENTTLMIGLSLTDPNLRRLLSISNRKNKLKKHYAIMKKADFIKDSDDMEIKGEILSSFNVINTDLQEKFFEQLGIKVIWIENYNEIPDIIENIRDL